MLKDYNNTKKNLCKLAIFFGRHFGPKTFFSLWTPKFGQRNPRIRNTEFSGAKEPWENLDIGRYSIINDPPMISHFSITLFGGFIVSEESLEKNFPRRSFLEFIEETSSTISALSGAK